MKSRRLVLAGIGMFTVTGMTDVAAQSAPDPPAHSALDVKELFAANCGFCHSDGVASQGEAPS